MPTFTIHDVTESHVYAIVTMDDGSTFGQFVRNIDRSSAEAATQSIRAALAATVDTLNPMVASDITELSGKANIPIENPAENTPEKIQQRLTNAVQAHLDSTARERGYDNIFTAATYATSLHVKFGPEGIAFRDWRDAVWDHCYQALAAVQDRQRSIPTEAELIAELPVFLLQ